MKSPIYLPHKLCHSERADAITSSDWLLEKLQCVLGCTIKKKKQQNVPKVKLIHRQGYLNWPCLCVGSLVIYLLE